MVAAETGDYQIRPSRRSGWAGTAPGGSGKSRCKSGLGGLQSRPLKDVSSVGAGLNRGDLQFPITFWQLPAIQVIPCKSREG